MDESVRPCAVTTHQHASQALTQKKNGTSCTHASAQAETLSESPEITEELRREALGREHAARGLQGAALENQIRKNRIRWLRTYITEVGMARARELGWPNTYTFTKSLAESLIATRGAGLPVAIVRPAIVETSIAKPFLGWNEGINTSASLLICWERTSASCRPMSASDSTLSPSTRFARGMTLIAAAVMERRHDAMYQLATSVSNPCDMRRSNRVDRPGASQTLPGAGGNRTLAAAALRHHSGLEATVSEAFGAGAADHGPDNPENHGAAATEETPLARTERRSTLRVSQ